jgi:GTP-binding protein HflX
VLLRTTADRLRALTNVVELAIPYDRGDVLAAVHREGEVLVEKHGEGATVLRARIDGAGAGKFREYVVEA